VTPATTAATNAAPSPTSDAPSFADCARDPTPAEGEACVTYPPANARARGIALFLHGMYRGDGGDADLRRMTTALSAAGFVVFAPQGRRGRCDWSDDAKGFVCFPTLPRQRDDMRAFVASWAAPIAAIDRALGRRLPIDVVGYSNGGFFAAALALQAMVPRARRFAVIHAGVFADELDPKPPPGPVLILMAARDELQTPKAEAFRALLERHGWANRALVTEGGHALTDADCSAVAAFLSER
jgi:dienelactone hydrolase